MKFSSDRTRQANGRGARWRAAFALAALAALAEASLAQTATQTIRGVRTWAAPDHTRVVLDLSEAVRYKMFSLARPDRLVLDLSGTRLRQKLPKPRHGDRYLKAIRSGLRNRGRDLRVVLDLKQPVRAESFVLEPNPPYGYRLVVDLYAMRRPSRPAPQPAPALPEGRPRDVIVVIDPGHGGDDPGAVGSRGAREKDVNLQISLKLARLIEREEGMRAALVREKDYFVRLKERAAFAYKSKADLFISIHADAFSDPRVRGSSVYVLSQKGASSENARQLADRENAADLVGGVSLADKEDMLAYVLLDLSQTGTLEASIEAAQDVLDQLNKIGKIRKRPLEAANFQVLRVPNVPSILVETGYISNPGEEKRLSDARYQRKLAKAILQGIRNYFHERPPEGTWLASRKARLLSKK